LGEEQWSDYWGSQKLNHAKNQFLLSKLKINQNYNNMNNTVLAKLYLRINRLSPIRKEIWIAVLFFLWGFQSVAQTSPVITVRFANPVYNCKTQQYSVSVEFNSNTAGLKMYEMNVRFYFESSVLDYKSIGDFAPWYINRGAPMPYISKEQGTNWGITGNITYWNGSVFLFNPYGNDGQGGGVLTISDTPGIWTKLFSINFNVLDQTAFADKNFCPCLVWDKEEDPSRGGFGEQSDGVVITCLKPNTTYGPQSVIEKMVQFNWEYDLDPTIPPYGSKTSATCVSGDNVPPVIITTAASHDLGCNPVITAPVFTVTDNCDQNIIPVITTNGPFIDGCTGSITWTANCSDSYGNAALPVSITYIWKIEEPIVIKCPEDHMMVGCKTQAEIDTEFGVWLDSFIAIGGCSSVLTTDPPSPVAPQTCNGSTTVIWFYTSDCGGTHSCTATFTTMSVATQTIDIKSGWNIISSNNLPANPDMKALFQTLITSGKLIKVQDEYGKSLENFGFLGGWINNIGNLQLTEGYKVDVNGDCQITFTGVPSVRPIEIPLHTGWNIIGFPHTRNIDAKSVVQQLIDRGTLIKVQDELGKSLENYGMLGGWINNIGDFIPGRGYKVKVAANDVLTIFEFYTKSVSVPLTELPAVHFQPVGAGNGVDHMNINLVDISHNGLKAGDEIAIFDGSLCVGAAKISEQQWAANVVSIPVRYDYGSNRQGFTEGNPFTVKIWDSWSGNEFMPDIKILKGTLTFVKHESSFVSLEKFTFAGLNENALPGSTQVRCYPNPFHDQIRIEVKPGKESELQAVIVNQLGQVVKTLVSPAILDNNWHYFTWNGTNDNHSAVSPGIYYLRILIDEEMTVQKIVFSR
jgi:hypothetical protein